MEISTQGIQMTYGNASKNTMTVSQLIQKGEVHMNLFIMRRALTKMTPGRENYILNQEEVSAILSLD